MARNYRREYDTYQGKPEQKKRRAQRNNARRKALRNGSVHKGDHKDVHHTEKNKHGKLDNSKTRVISRSKNRSMK